MIKDVSIKIGLDQPASVIGNSSQEVLELLAFANEEGRELTRRGNWQILTKEHTFNSLAAEQQAAQPSDFNHFIDETFWNRSRRIQFTGPVTSQEWQFIKATTSSQITNTFRFRGGRILLSPVPPAGEVMAYEYISKNWCQKEDLTPQCCWENDSDTGILDENIMGLGVLVRFKMAKGLPYSEDLAKYETQVKIALGIDAPKKTVRLSGGEDFSPSVGVPDGNWVV